MWLGRQEAGSDRVVVGFLDEHEGVFVFLACLMDGIKMSNIDVVRSVSMYENARP